MREINIYTDGGCRENPGTLGAWAFVVVDQEGHEMFRKSGPLTSKASDMTNNKAELQAMLEAMKWVNLYYPDYKTTITTDSEYVKKGVNEWLSGWKKKNWRTSNKGKVKNQALWKAIDKELAFNNFTVNWIKGHANHKWNEIADQLCNEEMDNYVDNQK